MPLNFLNPDAAPVAAPAIGGDFLPTGMIGLVAAKVRFSFMSQEDNSNYDGLPKPTERRETASGWFSYYFDNPVDAQALAAAMNVKGKPQRIWSFLMPRNSVMNFSDPAKLENFSDPIRFGDIRIVTMQSAKYRHEYHMFALPLAVQAAAQALGYSHVPFSISELLKKDVVFTDEFQRELIGDKENGYKDSLLWQRRAALWASLDEPNSEAYWAKGTDHIGTTSDKLNECLSIVTQPWGTQAYARIVTIPDPRVDSVYEKNGETRRTNIAAIYELFGTKKEAQEAAQKDIERMKKNADDAGNVPTAKDIPTAWVGLEVEWSEKVAELHAMPKPTTPALAKLAKSLDVTVSDLEPIWG